MLMMISVEHFTKKYGKFTAVEDVSFSVKPGSIFAFLGPNGAGKSTTINTLCTIMEKTSGTLTIDGKDVSTQTDAVRSVIGVVFQEPTLDLKMTVEENLKMHCYFYNLPKAQFQERIDFVLELVDLKDWKKAMAASLSGGMKRRVEIARSLLHLPKVLFLDEPTTGLDPQTRSNIWAYILKLQKEKGMTIFLTTHYMDEAEICDQVAIMDHGQIIAFDSPDALKKQHARDVARIRTADPKELERLLAEQQLTYEKQAQLYVTEASDLEKLLQVIKQHGPAIQDLEIQKGTLNDVFLNMTGRNIRG